MPPAMLKYRWWLKAYNMHPRDVDDLWDDEDYWIPVVEEAFGKVAEMEARAAQSQQRPGPRR
jgi:hypothetical protein